jgi:hypothetical protein
MTEFWKYLPVADGIFFDSVTDLTNRRIREEIANYRREVLLNLDGLKI